MCECVFPEFYWDCGHVARGEEEIRLQQRKYITEHLSSNKITCIICCGNPCPPPFLPCLALSLFFLSSTFSRFLYLHRCADSVTVKKRRMPPPHLTLPPHCPVSLFMNEGGLSLIVYLCLDFPWFCAATHWEEGWLHNGKSFCVCFGAELWRRATWKHSPGTLHAFSSSFAQSTGITGSGHQRVLMSMRVCLCVCLWHCMHDFAMLSIGT